MTGAQSSAAVPGQIPRWRIVAGTLVLAGLVLFAVWVGPIYVNNLKLQNYVSEITRSVANQTKTDDILRGFVLEKAQILGLPVTADNVHITRSGESLRIDVRYLVHLELPVYTVDLHFYPGAGSR